MPLALCLLLACLAHAGATAAQPLPRLAQRQLQADAPAPFDLVPAPTPNPPPMGVNLPDILWRSIDGNGQAIPAGLASAQATIAEACAPRGAAGARFLARFPILPMFPAGLRSILSNGTSYWPVLDALVQGLATAGCSFLVPVVFYNPYALADAYLEPMTALVAAARNATQLGGVSQAYDASLAFIDALVARYSTTTAIRAWELSHEWNLQYDMDASDGCFACNASLGTPAARSRGGHNVSTDDGGVVQRRWAARLRARDGALLRPISSGHALPRPAAYHLQQSYGRGSAAALDWTLDTQQQFTAYLNATHVGMDWVSVHLRPGAQMARAWPGLLPVPASSSTTGVLPLLVGLTQSLDNMTGVSTGGQSRQRLFIGEFGAPQGAGANSSNYTAGATFASGVTFVDELLQALLDTGLNAPSPPLQAITGLFKGAAVADFEFTDANARTASGLGGVYAAGSWPGQVDGVYAALVEGKVGNASGESLWPGAPVSAQLLGALAAYAALHSEPPFVVPGSCDLTLFVPPFNYHHTDRMQLGRECFSAIQQLAMGEFSPPSHYDVATAMCKGACRQYAAVWFRLQAAWAAAGCACTPPAWSPFGAPAATADPALANLTNVGFLCPHSPNAELCRRTGLCYEDYSFYNWTCSAGACGRFASSSKEYNAARGRCNLPVDGAGAGALAGLALGALVLASVSLVL